MVIVIVVYDVNISRFNVQTILRYDVRFEDADW